MSIASASDTPAISIIFETQVSVNTPEPARKGVPGTTTLPDGKISSSIPDCGVVAGRQSCQTAGIASDDQPMRCLDARNTLQHRCRQMMSVGDYACREFIGCELLPEIVFVTRQQGMGAVTEVSTQFRPCMNCIADSARRSSSVTDCHHDAGATKLFDKVKCVLVFRGQGYEANQSSRGFLPAKKLIPVGCATYSRGWAPLGPSSELI